MANETDVRGVQINISWTVLRTLCLIYRRVSIPSYTEKAKAQRNLKNKESKPKQLIKLLGTQFAKFSINLARGWGLY